MNTSKITSTLTALALCISSTLAMAQPRDDRDGKKEQTTQQNRPKQDQKGKKTEPQRAKNNQAQGKKHEAKKSEPARQQHASNRGAGPQNSYHRGDRLPPELRTRHAYIEDWRSYHLEAPPRGQQWVQLGADFVLIAVATGIITQIVLNNR